MLVHTGDFTNFGTYTEVEDFVQWMGAQPHSIKIVVPGNHDMIMDQVYWNAFWSDWSDEHVEGDDVKIKTLFKEHGIDLLIDERLDISVPIVKSAKGSSSSNSTHSSSNSSTCSSKSPDAEELKHPLLRHDTPPATVHDSNSGAIDDASVPPSSTLSIYGSPWVTKYASWSTAFNKVPSDMEAHWKRTLQKIQSHSTGHVDVLLTHMPPQSVGDMEPNGEKKGCPYLLNMVEILSPTVHVFGHVHSDAGWGKIVGKKKGRETQCFNAASVCDYYFLRPNPVTFEVSARNSWSSSKLD